jgi:hypothetical protein
VSTKRLIKYPNPRRSRFSSPAAIRSQAAEQKFSSSVHRVQSLLYFSCIGLILTSIGMGYYALFLKNSVQGVFNSILVLLSGVILFFMTSHENFVSRKLQAGVSVGESSPYSSEYSVD